MGKATRTVAKQLGLTENQLHAAIRANRIPDRPRWAAADDPTPSEAAMLTETLEHLMAGLDGPDRDVVTLQLQGYTIPEISARVHRSERTVCRVLDRTRRRLRRLREDEGPG